MSFRRMRHTKAREWQGCDVAYDFSNPASLYDATSGGSLVASGAAIARAEDQSGNAAHMTQATAANRPLRIVAAQNGLDAARFDGSNDYMTAGDVADVRLNTFDMAVVLRRASGSGVVGYLCKSFYGSAGGYFYLALDSTDSVGSNLGASQAVHTGSAPTTWQVLHGWHLRSSSSVAQQFVSRNAAAATAGSAFAANTATDYNTTYNLLMGAYNNGTDGLGPQVGTYLNGDVGEAAKWNRLIGDYPRRRYDHSRARKWGIAT